MNDKPRTEGAASQPAPPGHPLLFPPLPYHFAARANRAVDDVQLRQFLAAATVGKDQKRRLVLAQTFGSREQALRDLAQRIRRHTLDHLDHYLEQFAARARAAGTTVHFAADGPQANAIVQDIAREHQCRPCVKSKSMVTEETGLVAALESIGCKTVETDLAEYILQLDQDAPSHLVTAMIHKDRVAAGRALARELGVPFTDDPETITQIARRFLRDTFRRADLGVTGGNFLVAENGGLVLCTNEGNGRMTTTVPRVQVAVVGIEKVVPTLAHLGVLLKLLARSSTGQPLTIYTQILTGPRRAEEQGGPEHLHIIPLDNGRTRVLAGETRELLQCIRCGACLNACPVYRMIGGHAYGSVYSGPIGAVLTPALRGLSNYPDLAQASSLCGACLEACPVKIDIPRHLTRWRAEAVRERRVSRAEQMVFRFWTLALKHRWSYALACRVQKMVLWGWATKADSQPKQPEAPYNQRAWVEGLPGPLAGWTMQRDLPTPTRQSFRAWWRAEGRPEGEHGRAAGGREEARDA